MTNRRIHSITSATLLYFVIIAGVARANTNRYFSGTECEPWNFDNTGRVGRTNTGCSNYTSDLPDLLVVLPISGNLNSTVDYDSATVNVYDGHTNAEILCTLVVRNLSGSTYYGPFFGTGRPNTGYYGLYNTINLPNGGAAINDVTLQHIYCYVPSLGSYSGWQYSWIFNYATNTVNP